MEVHGNTYQPSASAILSEYKKLNLFAAHGYRTFYFGTKFTEEDIRILVNSLQF
jgi:hypothetical protein